MNVVTDRVLAALNDGDLDAFLTCYSADATIEDGNDTVLACGHDEIRERYGPMFETFPELRVEALGRWAVGLYVVQEEQVTGRAPEAERHIAVYNLAGDAIARERLLR